MMHDSFIEDEFGYYFVPLPHPGLHGHARLDVHLRNQPTFEHFDPEQIECTVKLSSGNNIPQLDSLLLSHPWKGGGHYVMACGHIFVLDRKGKKVDAFSFGGEIHVQAETDRTTVVFESPVPILEVTPINPVVDLFVDEVEIMLAMRRAEWMTTGPSKHTYEERLAQADPVDLYVACLLGVEERLARVYDGASASLLNLRRAIRAELHGLKDTGIWLGEQKRLNEVI